MKLKPTGAYILVKQSEQKIKPSNSFGIIIKTAEDSITKHLFDVVSLGEGIVLPNGTKTNFLVKEGDKLIIKGYSGDKVELEGQEYLFILQSDILAIIK